MLSNDSASKSQQSSSLAGPKAGGAEVPPMRSDDHIDVGPGGGGTVNDPPPADNRPPSGIADLDYLA
jgi:hypothetical protein